MIRTLALLLVAACGGAEPVTSCASSLAGTWRSDTGERWTLIDNGKTIEAYPLFDDTRRPGVTAEVGARTIDLARERGSVKRRFTSATATCFAAAPARLVSCANDTLELVLADPAPPISFAPCAFASAEPSRRERWTRD